VSLFSKSDDLRRFLKAPVQSCFKAQAARGHCSIAICMQIAQDGQLAWNRRQPEAKKIYPSGIHPASFQIALSIVSSIKYRLFINQPFSFFQLPSSGLALRPLRVREPLLSFVFLQVMEGEQSPPPKNPPPVQMFITGFCSLFTVFNQRLNINFEVDLCYHFKQIE